MSVQHDIWTLFYRNTSPKREQELKSELYSYTNGQLEDGLKHFIWWCNHTPRGWQTYHKRLRKLVDSIVQERADNYNS